jgi:hypothetical protein
MVAEWQIKHHAALTAAHCAGAMAQAWQSHGPAPDKTGFIYMLAGGATVCERSPAVMSVLIFLLSKHPRCHAYTRYLAN